MPCWQTWAETQWLCALMPQQGQIQCPRQGISWLYKTDINIMTDSHIISRRWIHYHLISQWRCKFSILWTVVVLPVILHGVHDNVMDFWQDISELHVPDKSAHFEALDAKFWQLINANVYSVHFITVEICKSQPLSSPTLHLFLISSKERLPVVSLGRQCLSVTTRGKKLFLEMFVELLGTYNVFISVIANPRIMQYLFDYCGRTLVPIVQLQWTGEQALFVSPGISDWVFPVVCLTQPVLWIDSWSQKEKNGAALLYTFSRSVTC